MANSNLNIYRTLHTQGYHGHSVKFSPFDADLFAVSGAENFGIKGVGSLILYNLNAKNSIIKKFTYPDALYDLCWMTTDPDVIITGSGDGCVQIWCTNKPFDVPMSCKKVHLKEVSSVECSKYQPEYFATSSWDSTVKMCDINQSSRTVLTMKGHSGMVYEARWSTTNERNLLSVSEDGKAILWSPFRSESPSLVLPETGSELLSCDWSYSDPNLVVTASTGAVLFGWDLRKTAAPVFHFQGHESAVRKVRFSPYIATEIASVSYDFSTRLWDLSTGSESCCLSRHSEFVYALDYSVLRPGMIVDCSWDQTVNIYKIGPPRHHQGGLGGPTPLSAIENRVPSPFNAPSPCVKSLPLMPKTPFYTRNSFPVPPDAHQYRQPPTANRPLPRLPPPAHLSSTPPPTPHLSSVPPQSESSEAEGAEGPMPLPLPLRYARPVTFIPVDTPTLYPKVLPPVPPPGYFHLRGNL